MFYKIQKWYVQLCRGLGLNTTCNNHCSVNAPSSLSSKKQNTNAIYFITDCVVNCNLRRFCPDGQGTRQNVQYFSLVLSLLPHLPNRRTLDRRCQLTSCYVYRPFAHFLLPSTTLTNFEFGSIAYKCIVVHALICSVLLRGTKKTLKNLNTSISLKYTHRWLHI